VKPVIFTHPSEQIFANCSMSTASSGEYEPHIFAVQWDKAGMVLEHSHGIVYLPEFDM
jgi:hypothetical protein